VTGLTTALTLANGQALKASGTTTTGTISTNATKGLTLAANSPLQFSAFNGTTAPLTIFGAGSVVLASGNVVTVTVANGGTPLGAGDYTLIAKGATGSVTGTAPTSLTVNGDGIPGGAMASLQITGQQLILHIAIVSPPTITAGGPLTRQQGVAAINSTIATVSDSSAGTLTVTATTVPTGISVTNIVNSSGTVTADVAAGCNAATGANTVVLTVTNGTTGLMNTANLTVNVTANTPPVLTYNNATVSLSGSTTINPVTGPSDNVSVSTIAVQSQGTYTGTISVDNTTGVVSISNAAPPGMHTITIRATDNCGSPTGVTDATFTLTVDCPTSFTVNDLGDSADAAPGNGLCATGGGVCTLRAAIEEANALQETCTPLTINFSVTGTINLLSELPWLEHPNLTIQGPGANLLNVHRDNGAGTFTVFIVTGDVVTLNHLTVSNGDASGTFDAGGGIYSGGQLLTINRCHITGNTASQGGGVFHEGGNLQINDSTISNNSAGSEGGGVYNLAGEGTSTMTLTNCTISANSVTGSGGPSTAGGVVNSANAGGTATINIVNCTITGNNTASSANAGGIFSGTDGDIDSEANINLKNTILAGNNDAQALTANGGTITSQGNNLDGDGTTGFINGVNGNIVGTIGTPVNPLLAVLGNYGGTTPTHALLLGSPAINAGASTGAPSTDQRGIARPQLTLFDIGAFESQGFALAIASGSPQSATVNTAFANPLSVTVTANDAGVPVDGGIVTFTPPGSGASASVAGSPASISGGTATSGTVTANSITGAYSVSANATGATAPVSFSLTNTCQTITVNAPGVNTGTVGAAFSQMFTQTGGIGATTFSTASTLPNGITLAANGTLAGTPTQSGSFPLTVKATDSNGCMGTVLYTLTINALPTINAVAVTRTAGSPSSNSTIANVNDAETAAGSLTVTVNSAASATVNGVTVSNIVNTGGTISADVVAACGATTANFTLTVTDGGGATNTTTLTVTVNANTPPVLTYNNASALTGNATTVNPATGPSDNGSISTIVVQTVTPSTAPGTITVNNSSGVVSVPNNVPTGTYTVTIRATDQCGAFTDAPFTLTVGCVNALTVNNLGDGADFAPGNGVCETATGNGICTLRAAIEEANALTSCSPLTINFSVTGTISLATALPNLDHPNLTISGPGASSLTVQRSTVSGTGNFRIFFINGGKTVAISGLTITNGMLVGSGAGGGVRNLGTLSLTNCVISNNTATGQGGGVHSNGSLSLTDCIVSGNTTTNPIGAFGGGVYVTGPLTITRCAITNNTSRNGAGIAVFDSTATISDSTVSGNIASNEAGGVIVQRATTTLSNCTISGNTANGSEIAGGVLHTGSTGETSSLTLINCTVTGNAGNNGAGVISVSSSSTSIVTQLKNTLVAGNTGNNFGTTGTNASLTSQGNNLDSDGTSGFTNGMNGDIVGTIGSPINALLAALGNYGGPTQTQALLPGSPAINAGTNTGTPATDQRGSARLGVTDIGAFESQGFTLAVTSGNNQSAVVNTAFALPLKVTVTASGSEPVDGGKVTFTPPGSGASATVAGSPVTIASGMATTGTVTANSVTGTYNVAASANGAAAAVSFSLTNTCQTITVTNPGTNTGTANSAFSATFTQTGGIGMTTFSTASTLPTGITLASNGLLSGTPTQTGSFPITVKATDSNNCMGTSVGYTLTINCQTITVNSPGTNTGTTGTPFSQTFTQTGGIGTTNFSTASTLPTGITLSTGGLLSGTPTQSGVFPITIKATDANGCMGTASYTLTINQAPAFTSANTTTFTVNTASSFTITTSGFPTVTTITQMGALPSGVMFTNNGNGTATLSGTPAVGSNGNYPLTLTASNGVAPNATQNFTLVVSGLVCPSLLTVNNLGDAGDANPGDGICATDSVVCTLRAAIEEANAIPACTPLTINFSVTGTINLGSVLPDLNHPNLTITGPGAANLTVARNSATLFRIFAISASRTVTITGLKITNGLAPGTNNGGGVHNSGTLTLSQCVVSANAIETTSVGGVSFGGGIYSAGPLTIDRCEISGNSGRSGAGITHNGLGSGYPLIITNSTISGNTGVQSGGFDIRNTSASLTNCTISGNIAPGRIGGIDQVAQSGNTSSLSLTNCTVTNNTGSAAIETFGFAGVTSLTTTLKNTLVAGNVGANFTTTMGTLTSLGNNLDSDGTSGFTNGTNGDIVGSSGSPINALLGPLTNNGGPTNTHLLLPGSPAIDKGGAGVSTDQRGQSRPYDFPAIPPASNGGNNSDIGAVEVQCSTITLAGLPGGTAGVAYTQSNLASGGTAPYTLSLASGALPPGVTISGNGLTGTPTQPGTFSFTLNANDAYGCTGSQSYTVSIVCPTIMLSPAALPNATVNVAYPQTITAAPSASYAFSVTSGLLPAGLTLNSNGSFSGAPTQSGVFNFRITAVAFGTCTGFRDYTLTVACPTITLNPASLAGGTIGTAYSQSVSATPAGTYSYALTNGSLPTGLSLNASTGAITGTPSIAGNFTFIITAAAGGCTGSRSYTVTIICPSITLGSLSTATAGIAYSSSVAASPAGTYTYSLIQGNLPSGLTLNTSTGVISGLPVVAGTYNFIVKAQIGDCSSGAQSYSLVVNCPTITISPGSLPNGTVGTGYSQTVAATPATGAYLFAVSSGSLPTGLTLNAIGTLSGTPSANGTFNFSVTALGFGTCPSAPKAYSITIGGGGCPTITLPNITTSGSVGSPYNESVAASPAGSYTYTMTSGAPPTGVTFYSAAGLLFGYPTAAGSYSFTIKATDSNGCMASKDYTVNIGLGFSPAFLQDATVGRGYTQRFQPLGTASSVSFTMAEGKLPKGLSLATDGTLSGTPTEKGSYPLRLRVADSANSGTQQVTLKVNDASAPVVGGSIVDPLNCTRGGSAVNVTAIVSNTSGASQTANFTATLPAQLLALPGSCVVNTGSCQVVSLSSVTWTGTLANNQSVTINYQAQIADGTPAGAQVCVTSTANFVGGGSASVPACTTLNCPTIGPGLPYPASSQISDQKAGSVLIYNIYTSASDPTRQNTRLSITNTDTARGIAVHLFFVDGSSCSVADSILCLTPNQTASFLASDLDPGTTGYVVAVAIDSTGCPTNFNFLIGDEYVKFSSGHAANLAAEAIAALPGGLAFCNTNSSTATLAFDGISYNVVPHVLAGDNVASRADGNDTLLILNRIGGNLATGASTLGTLFGLFYNDTETGVSFQISAGSCQFRSSITNNLPRITPRFEQFVPAGRSGWFKVWAPGLFGMTGALINSNPNAGSNAGAFDQGHNLHKLTSTSTASYVIPVFPPGC
jgi:CSLREA domain-containing protein